MRMATGKSDDYREGEKGAVDFDINKPTLRCGLGRCRPTWLQKCADIRAYLFSYSFAAMVSSALGIYMISQVTTFEKLLGLSSKQAGFLLSANDVGYLLVIVFASHLGRKSNKPVLLGSLIMGFGILAIVCGMPHFLMVSYKGLFYSRPGDDALTDGVSSGSSDVALCNANRSASAESRDKDDADKAFVRKVSFAIMAMSLVLQGAAKAPRYPLSLTYIDDHVPKTKVGLYVGISFAIIILGLAVATGLGSAFTRIYATLEHVSLSPRDPRWVGAWWLGFVVIGTTACMSGIPLLLFPKYLRTNAMFRNVDQSGKLLNGENGIVDETNLDDDESSHRKHETGAIHPTMENGGKAQGKRLLKQETKDFPKALLRLMNNPMYVCILAANGIGTLGFLGRMVYFPKYLEVHFGMLPHRAILMFGITILVGAAAGSIASGVLMAILKMSPKSSLLFVIVIGTPASLLSFVGLALDCPQLPYEGYDMGKLLLRDPGGSSGLFGNLSYFNSSCSGACACVDDHFLPICGDDGLTYFSPCHAGCNGISPVSKSFGNCSCMPASSNRTASSGNCSKECSNLTAYLVFAFISPLLGMLTVTPKVVVKLRCVSEEDRSLSVGVNSFFTNLMGSFLSPILYGWLIDLTCVLWVSGSCRIYDTADFRYRLHTTSGVIGIGADVMYMIAFVIVVFNKRYRALFEKDETKKGRPV